MNDTIPQEVKTEMETQNHDIVVKATGLVIKDEHANLEATGLLTAIKTMRTKVEDTFGPSVKAAKTAYDEAKSLRDTFLDPLKDVEAQLRSKIGAYITAETARRDALQAKADAKFEKAVERAEATGKALTVAPVIVAKVSAATNASYTKRWSAQVTDIKALCLAVAEGRVPVEYVTANMPVLNRMAVSSKDALNIPGIKAVSQISASVRV
jgi:hypothetical protein